MDEGEVMMIRDIIDWTKAYLLFVVISPIITMLSTPIIVLIDGQVTRTDMFDGLLAIDCVGTLVWLLTITGVVVKCCYKKLKGRL
jgi:hypothetical protein